MDITDKFTIFVSSKHEYMGDIKELRSSFGGVGEVKGFLFDKVLDNGRAYIYAVTCDGGSVHYEVFERRVNERFGVVSYPKSNAFGDWAYTCTRFCDAIRRFEELTERVDRRITAKAEV